MGAEDMTRILGIKSCHVMGAASAAAAAITKDDIIFLISIIIVILQMISAYLEKRKQDKDEVE